MPIEHREILLNEQEVVMAATAFFRTRPADYPAGRILSAAGRATPDGPQVDVQVATAPDGEPRTVVLEGQPIIDLLTRFCHENNIPIPRAGVKRVGIDGTTISLKISLGDMEAR